MAKVKFVFLPVKNACLYIAHLPSCAVEDIFPVEAVQYSFLGKDRLSNVDIGSKQTIHLDFASLSNINLLSWKMSRQALKRTSPLRFTTGRSLVNTKSHTICHSPPYLSVYLTMFSRDRSLLARKALNIPLMPALVAWRKCLNKQNYTYNYTGG